MTTTETRTEFVIHYVNVFEETLRLPMDPDTVEAQAQYAWRKEEERLGHYKDARWESRVVTTITTPWKIEENNQ